MGDYRVTETKAPEGYNKLTESFLVSAEKIRATRTDASTYLDENGNVDPAQLTFVYKTGLKNSVDGAKFKPQRKNARGRHRADELCSHDSNEVDKMCSDSSNDTCGVRTSNDP